MKDRNKKKNSRKEDINGPLILIEAICTYLFQLLDHR